MNVVPAPTRLRTVRQLPRACTAVCADVRAGPAAWEHLGNLGPVIHAVVGDRVHIVFKNNLDRPASIHMHGLKYDKASEGAPYDDGTAANQRGGDAVPPGRTYTYDYTVPDRAGPGPMDPSSVMWTYHSHTDEIGDTYAGLMGPVIVTRPGMARPDGSPMTVEVGPRVRWYLMGMGTEVDLHTPHWHGNTAVANGMRTDVAALLPAQMVTADMTADNPGTWLFHCHVNDHIAAGMLTRYRLFP